MTNRSAPLRQALLLLLLALVPLPLFAFAPDRAGFSVRIQGEDNPHSVLGVFVLPGDSVPIAVQPKGRLGMSYELEAAGGSIAERGPGSWVWTAPKGSRGTGYVTLSVREQPTGRSMRLNAFLLVPSSGPLGGSVNGYKIGNYPEKPLRDMPVYLPPPGYIEVTAANEDVRVAPHLTLGQFVCKQGGAGFPKYIFLREKLLLALEAVLEGVNRSGLSAETFHVMSGYRTPAYNRAIGNTTDYSRHLYGDAADVFIDDDKDGKMDDLNGDGRSDYADAELLGARVERILHERFIGGLGLYEPNPAHGPFVHIDTRGYAARWANARGGG
jgi:hypothetical protein